MSKIIEHSPNDYQLQTITQATSSIIDNQDQ